MNLHPAISDHWHGQYDNLQLSTNDFYTALEQVLTAKAFPYVTFARKELYQGGWMSEKREYFIVSRFEYKFIICAAPFGRDFFFSWYLREYQGWNNVWRILPFIGNWFIELNSRKTYFEYDTEIMFKDSIKHVVRNVLLEVEKEKGMREVQTQFYLTDAQ